jgi:hypothetical protein
LRFHRYTDRSQLQTGEYGRADQRNRRYSKQFATGLARAHRTAEALHALEPLLGFLEASGWSLRVDEKVCQLSLEF